MISLWEMPMLSQHQKITDAYAEMVLGKLNEGWEPHLLTFLFHPIKGSPSTLKQRMVSQVEITYRWLLTRLVRHPRTKQAASLPLWLAAPDFPVLKKRSEGFVPMLHNDGLHYHAICLLPRQTRVSEPFAAFVAKNTPMICRASILQSVHVEPITHSPKVVVEYALKEIMRRRDGTEHITILPKSTSEL